jgi:hypothetical protein
VKQNTWSVNIDQVAQPLERIDGEGVLHPVAVLVGPMRRDAGLGHLVHGVGADLHLDPHCACTIDGGVDRAVPVRLWPGNIVLEPPWHVAPMPVDRAQCPVTVLLGVAQNPKPVDVGQLREAGLLLLHLAPDRIGPLLAPLHLDGDTDGGDGFGNLGADLRDQVAGVALQFQEPAHQRGAGLGVQHLEGQVLQLDANRLHPHAPGQRGVDIHGLVGDALALLGRQMAQRAHVVDAVGQLDQDHPHIRRHRQQQLAEILGLGGFRRGQLQLGQLGDAIDQIGDLGAEQARYLLAGRRGVLDGVVQQRGDDRGIVQLQIGQDRRDFQRMAEKGLAAGALLIGMGLGAEHIGPVQQQLIGAGVVFPDPLDKFELTDHGPAPKVPAR